MNITANPAAGPVDEIPYFTFLDALQERFTTLTAGQSLFTTLIEGAALWEEYLAAIPEAVRQHNNCHTCRQFLERYGTMVLVSESGALRSPIWEPELAAPELKGAVGWLKERVEGSKVNGVFLSRQTVWGTPVTGVWRHLAVRPASTTVYRSAVLTPGQRQAELKEDFRCLLLALDEFRPAVLGQARVILEADTVARAEKFLGPVTWLEERQRDRQSPDPRLRTNRLWRAVATAPVGFCKPRSGMVGTLLEDLIAGLPLEEVKRRFDAKMHPLQYQRPQAAPSLGTIQQAEETFAKLGLAPALERRLALLEDVPIWLWQPAPHREPETAGKEGVFDHLKPVARTGGPLALPGTKTITWVKFRDTVLPQARRIELTVPAQSGAFCAFVTAVDPGAPPLLRWDREEQRNPVNWYYYHGARSASDWSLSPGPVPVVGITAKPPHWYNPVEHEGQAVMWVLGGCRDRHNDGLALFPETLRSELHGTRSVLEAYSRSRKLQPVEGPLASGIMCGEKNRWENIEVCVTTPESVTRYKLDRWD